MTASTMSNESDGRVLRRDPNPHLFRPLAMRSVTAKNRIMLSPMCQYSATDWVDGGWTLEDSIDLCRVLKARGQVDLMDCSSGGNHPRQKLCVHPGYQVPLAAAMRANTGLMTAAGGLIHSPDLAESILANQQADLIVLGRALLGDPVWPLRAAKQLQATVKWPVQYERGNIF